ncbi:hypothetical protein GG681_03845 [Epibacterium sp. SM1969]|uniref:Uncharacterized protein n=1 Tax=Tritonibacter aquimaris TaxID=2663379 RepID=A0A844AKM6_9RHOB|nr:hypothetical protein [Tritonibacter aquimaris]MQY41759.1 hypothetical protein [Tritonibacter aquimaris]
MLLDESRFAGKSVLLAGPARTLEADLKGLSATDFDIIVKMNNGLFVPLPFERGHTLRCDVLFHSLTEDITPVTPQALDTAAVRHLVHRTTGKGRFPLTLDASRALGSESRSINLIAPECYQTLSARLGGFSPTTGLTCLNYLLKCNTDRLVIGGFTFFQTKYQPGYDDRDKSDADSIARVKHLAHHDPDAERKIAQQLIDDARLAGKSVVLGPAVEAALQGQYLNR